MDVTSTFDIVSTLFGFAETVCHITRYNDGCTVAALVNSNDKVVDGRCYRGDVSNRAIMGQLFEPFEYPYLSLRRA